MRAKGYDDKQFVLVGPAGGELQLPATIEREDGSTMFVTGGRPPHKPSSTGRIYVEENGGSREYYPSVADCAWEEL